MSDFAIENLEKQNEKLRKELKELRNALAIVKKKNSGEPLNRKGSEEKCLSSTDSKIKRFKIEINRMKNELEGNLNISKITELENQSKFLSKKIEELESEQKSLKKIEKAQQNALDFAKNSNSYPEKIAELKEEIRVGKEKYRELVLRHKQNEKVHKKEHEKYVDLDEKCRKLFELIKSQKKNEVTEGNEEKPSEIDLENLEKAIEKAKLANNEEEIKAKKRIHEYNTQAREGKHHLEMLKIKLKEKDQECRLTFLKIKELKKVTQHNHLKPLGRISGNSTPFRLSNQNLKKTTETAVNPRSTSAKRVESPGFPLKEDFPTKTLAEVKSLNAFKPSFN